MEIRTKPQIRGTVGCELLRYVESVDPRAAEGLRRENPSDVPPDLEVLLEEETRHSITDAYQKLLFEVKVLYRKGNFKSSQGEVIVQRVRDIASGGKTLDLSGFIIFDEFVDLLVPYLRSKTCKLQALNLARTPIGVQAAISVAQASNSVLQILQFSDRPIPVESIRTDAAKNGRVVLSGQNFNHLDAAAIGILVERERKKIQRLDLSGSLLTGPKANVYHGISTIFQGLKSCHQLQELNLSSANLRSDGLVALANAIQDYSVLEKLDLSRNRVTHNSSDEKRVAGFEAFCNALWRAEALRELNLTGNYLDYLCSVHIAAMLKVNRTLRVLDLSQNPLADAGVVELSTGLKKNASLLSLNLSECQFSCEGLNEVVTMLRKYNSTLQTLDITNNTDVRSQGYRSLVKCVSINPRIIEVVLNPGPRYEKFASKTRDYLVVNALLNSMRTDATRFSGFPEFSEMQRTNFVEKLERFSEKELRQLHEERIVEKAAMFSDEKAAAGLSTLRHYATQEQFAPLKRLLWVFETGSRHDDLVERREQSNNKKTIDSDEDDEDIWDYPLV